MCWSEGRVRPGWSDGAQQAQQRMCVWAARGQLRGLWSGRGRLWAGGSEAEAKDEGAPRTSIAACALQKKHVHEDDDDS